ncbi:uncharacterized protein LOC143512317 [Brachyhypopomus gauderio]|uniref:uncharacterized protein LOC143512317 n=1 Tax=Brachyhypopomus gauderio TaxID=698409 RepID=UPI0040420A83
MEWSVSSVFATAFVICLASAGLNGTRVWRCDRATFDNQVHNHCVPLYKQKMAGSNYQKECPWPTTKGHYTQLDMCVSEVAKRSRCVEPSLKDEIFLELHRTYFSLCFFMQDPGVHVTLLLVLPCVIATFLFPFCCVHLTSATT